LKLILVRHGETPLNSEKRLTGQLDVPLTDIGEQQATAVRERLAGQRIDLLLSSTLIRAQRTAEIIGEAHTLAPQTCNWLDERFCGVLEGLTKAEMKQQYPQAHKAYKSRHLNLPIDGNGETSQQFYTRVANGLESLARDQAKQPELTVVAASHGGTIREAFNFVFNTQQNGNHLRCLNCSVSIFHCVADVWSMECWGDTSHLR
jgi:probable phosphoglycerate mutase